jgi:hypothetical protein
MTSITISIPENRLEQLQEFASRLGVTTEDLVRFSIEDILSKPDEALQDAINYVLSKNAELYGRLA